MTHASKAKYTGVKNEKQIFFSRPLSISFTPIKTVFLLRKRTKNKLIPVTYTQDVFISNKRKSKLT